MSPGWNVSCAVGPSMMYSVAMASTPPGLITAPFPAWLPGAFDAAKVLDRRKRVGDVERVIRELEMPAVHLHEPEMVLRGNGACCSGLLRTIGSPSRAR
jgi:hypothetical protein